MSKTETYGNSTTRKSGATKTTSKEKNKKECNLDEIFEKELKDVYSAEQQLIEALPQMAKAAYSEDLQDAFENHLQQTKRQAERLEKIFDRLDIDTNETETCKAMEGLIKEGKDLIEEYDQGPGLDAALIIAAQKVEHYEIASYGSLRELADVLGYTKVADMLDRTLEEEEDTDELLTRIAEYVNDEACEVGSEETMS